MFYNVCPYIPIIIFLISVSFFSQVRSDYALTRTCVANTTQNNSYSRIGIGPTCAKSCMIMVYNHPVQIHRSCLPSNSVSKSNFFLTINCGIISNYSRVPILRTNIFRTSAQILISHLIKLRLRTRETFTGRYNNIIFCDIITSVKIDANDGKILMINNNFDFVAPV